MGLRDRVLDYIAKAFMPVPDHPSRGGMTGETTRDREGDEDDDPTEATEDADGDRDRT